jgi:hypothetical protein
MQNIEKQKLCILIFCQLLGIIGFAVSLSIMVHTTPNLITTNKILNLPYTFIPAIIVLIWAIYILFKPHLETTILGFLYIKILKCIYTISVPTQIIWIFLNTISLTYLVFFTGGSTTSIYVHIYGAFFIVTTLGVKANDKYLLLILFFFILGSFLLNLFKASPISSEYIMCKFSNYSLFHLIVFSICLLISLCSALGYLKLESN